jgi:hypothetical protein
MTADEVIVEPGNYSDTAGDLGVDGFVSPTAGNIHGVLGQPRPVITLNDSHAFGAFDVSTGKTVSYLSVQSTVSDRGIFIGGGTVDAVIARATGSFGATCQHTSGILRDTACIATSASGIAAGVSVGTSGALSPVLRNVTAISLGGSGFGLDYRVSGGGSLTVSAKSVIADGGSADIRVGGTSPSTSTLTVDHSNFATTSVLAGGTVTDGGNNQSSAPMLASDHVHQLSGSPTIEAGAVDGSSGATDVDGQNRTLGAAPDIGADELGHPTTTSTACSPASVHFAAPTTCTLTVTDTAAGATTPTGTVALSSDTSGGFFGSGGTCTLSMVSSSSASCQVTYTPGQVGDGSHDLTGTYVGDSTHEPSQGSTSLTVTAHPTVTTVSCDPPSVLFASPTKCTAYVTDQASTAWTTPTGGISFLSDATGSFGSSAACTLAPINTQSAGCSVTYTPGAVGDGTHQITATYGADGDHTGSSGMTSETVDAHPTTTDVSCTPNPVRVGQGGSCVVTVIDSAAIGATSPTGTVAISSSAPGSFGGACSLAPATGSSATCTVAYTPAAVATHILTASYAGDGGHGASLGTDMLAVTDTTGPGTTFDPCPALRKKLRKTKKAHHVPKVRKLKKKLRRLGC